MLRITKYCPTGTTTSLGAWPRPGIVAVKAGVAPYGARLRIEGLGTYLVADREPSHGVSHVDIFINGPRCKARAYAFGIKLRKVTYA